VDLDELNSPLKAEMVRLRSAITNGVQEYTMKELDELDAWWLDDDDDSGDESDFNEQQDGDYRHASDGDIDSDPMHDLEHKKNDDVIAGVVDSARDGNLSSVVFHLICAPPTRNFDLPY